MRAGGGSLPEAAGNLRGAPGLPRAAPPGQPRAPAPGRDVRLAASSSDLLPATAALLCQHRLNTESI